MRFWQEKGLIAQLLFPVSLLFKLCSCIRRYCYQSHLFSTYQAPVPVIVIGNITVGGTGKTPLVIALSNALFNAGYQVGIISRGYKSHPQMYPYVLSDSSTAEQAGDEPLLIYQATNMPVVIDPDRCRAVQKLLATHHCDVIISDDGLQHYHLHHDIEIAVIDGDRRFGNGFCLPAGPLRESISRLKTVDIVVANGKDKESEILMQLIPGDAYLVKDPSIKKPLSDFAGSKAYALAGIGHPARFFQMLKHLDIMLLEEVSYADHYQFDGSEFDFSDNEIPIFITEKDAVKCASLNKDNVWAIPVTAQLPDSFYKAVISLLGPASGNDSDENDDNDNDSEE